MELEPPPSTTPGVKGSLFNWIWIKWFSNLFNWLKAVEWHDITSEVTVRGVGASNPTWSQVGSSVIYAYKFSVGDECWMNFHIPHDYKKSTDIYMHCHWLPDGTNTQPVKWQFEYAYAHGHDQSAFPIASLTTTDATQTVGGTQYQHYITESAAQTITGMEPDGIIAIRITRITNGATNNTDGIFLLTSDIHYQSTNRGTLNRSPDFYK